MRLRTSLVALVALGSLGMAGLGPRLGRVLAFQGGPPEIPSHLVWYDRSGKRLTLVDSPANERGLELSPDGTRATVSMLTASRGTRDIWVVDMASGNRTRFTDDGGDKLFSIWSPDGNRVVFDRDMNTGGARDLFEKPLRGGADTLLFSDRRPKWPLSFSPDGRYLTFVTVNARTTQDIEVLPLTGSDRKPIPFQQAEGLESYPRFSPDGKWIAFGWDSDIYVAPFPGPGRKVRVSSDGGSWPRWRRDGKELFYVATGLKNTLMAVPVSAQGTVFTSAEPQKLFEIEPVVGGFYSYDISADGQRVLVNAVASAPTTAPRSVIAFNGPPPALEERARR